ncbi:hypothetical protein ETD83_39950, partial [Actinomadura soli]
MGIRDLFSRRRSRPAAGPDAPGVAGGPDGGWRAVPPPGRPSTMGTIADPAFGATLASWQVPSLAGEIVRQISLDGPGGVLGNPLRPAGTLPSQHAVPPPVPAAAPPPETGPEPPRLPSPLTVARGVDRPSRKVRAAGDRQG